MNEVYLREFEEKIHIHPAACVYRRPAGRRCGVMRQGSVPVGYHLNVSHYVEMLAQHFYLHWSAYQCICCKGNAVFLVLYFVRYVPAFFTLNFSTETFQRGIKTLSHHLVYPAEPAILHIDYKSALFLFLK